MPGFMPQQFPQQAQQPGVNPPNAPMNVAPQAYANAAPQAMFNRPNPPVMPTQAGIGAMAGRPLYNRPSPVASQAQNVARAGRYGDTTLVHMNPEEVRGISSVLPMTTNPDTGYPEMFLPALLGLAAPMLGGAAGLGTGALATGLMAGGGALAGGLLQGDDLETSMLNAMLIGGGGALASGLTGALAAGAAGGGSGGAAGAATTANAAKEAGKMAGAAASMNPVSSPAAAAIGSGGPGMAPIGAQGMAASMKAPMPMPKPGMTAPMTAPMPTPKPGIGAMAPRGAAVAPLPSGPLGGVGSWIKEHPALTATIGAGALPLIDSLTSKGPKEPKGSSYSYRKMNADREYSPAAPDRMGRENRYFTPTRFSYAMGGPVINYEGGGDPGNYPLLTELRGPEMYAANQAKRRAASGMSSPSVDTAAQAAAANADRMQALEALRYGQGNAQMYGTNPMMAQGPSVGYGISAGDELAARRMVRGGLDSIPTSFPAPVRPASLSGPLAAGLPTPYAAQVARERLGAMSPTPVPAPVPVPTDEEPTATSGKGTGSLGNNLRSIFGVNDNEVDSYAMGGVPGEPMRGLGGHPLMAQFEPNIDNGDDRQIVLEMLMALRGQHPNPEVAVRKFIQRFGRQAFEDMLEREMSGTGMTGSADRISNGQGGEVVAPPGGDMMPATNPDGAPAALGNNEFVVPEEMNAALDPTGRGNPKNGIAALEGVRQKVMYA